MENQIMKRWILGRCYSWDAAKIVIDYLENHGIEYRIHKHNNVWDISYDAWPEHYGIFNELPWPS